jgi:hypothetical protein
MEGSVSDEYARITTKSAGRTSVPGSSWKYTAGAEPRIERYGTASPRCAPPCGSSHPGDSISRGNACAHLSHGVWLILYGRRDPRAMGVKMDLL